VVESTAEAKPWEFPEPGDVLRFRDGRTHRVVGTSAVGSYAEVVQYALVDVLFRERWVDCSGRTWRRKALAEVAKGGTYERRQATP
jgi:hypothetical protein